jgi:hypothetical protein
MITALVLIAKFFISFPFNGLMIITSELQPTGKQLSLLNFN